MTASGQIDSPIVGLQVRLGRDLVALVSRKPHEDAYRN